MASSGNRTVTSVDQEVSLLVKKESIKEGVPSQFYWH